MIGGLVLAMLWIAALQRLRVLWRTRTTVAAYYAVAAVGVAMALTLKTLQPQVDRVAGAYMSDLLLHLFVIVGGVGAQLFLLSLRDGRPSRRAVGARVAVAGLVGAVMIACFAAAPIHAVTSAKLDEHFGKLGIIQAYRGVLNAYLTYVLLDNIRLCRRYATARDDVGRAVGLTLVGWACGIGLAYSVSRLVLAVVNPIWHGQHHGWLLFGQGAALASLGLLAAGVLVPHWLPLAIAFRDARQGVDQLAALWADLAAAFPAVVLPTPAAWTVRRAQLRYDRRLLEVAEGLARASLGAECGDVGHVQGDVERTAVVLARSRAAWTGDFGPKATTLLPPIKDARTEHRFLHELAAAYSSVARTQPLEGVPA